MKSATEVDRLENEIRANPHHYNCVVFAPRHTLQTYENLKSLEDAKVLANRIFDAFPEVRTVMIHAVSFNGSAAMHGYYHSYHLDRVYIPVEERL